jgi:hypothetical protein
MPYDHSVRKAAMTKVETLDEQGADLPQKHPPDVALMKYVLREYPNQIINHKTLLLLKNALNLIQGREDAAKRMYNPDGEILMTADRIKKRTPIRAGVLLIENLHPMAQQIIDEHYNPALRKNKTWRTEKNSE